MTTHIPPQSEKVTRPTWAASVVEEQLLMEFPVYALAAALAPLNDESRRQHEHLKAQRDTRRASLLTLSLPELETLRSRQAARTAQEKREREERAAAKAAKKEAAKFYNQPQAVADFDHWGKLEYWTFDEALALLLGKNPRVLTPEAMRREVSPGWALLLLEPQPESEKSAFVRAFENLRHLAERAAVMQGPRLQPAQVLLWAHHNAGIVLPPALLSTVAGQSRRAQRDTKQLPPATPEASDTPTVNGSTDNADDGSPVVLKRAALISEYQRSWRSIESNLNHANDNGLSARAKSERRGYWRVADALQWARENGKLQEHALKSKQGSHNPFGILHRSDA